MEAKRWDAVVFDYGRVLSVSPTPAELQQFARLVGVSEPPFFDLYSDTRDGYDCGREDCQQHWQKFAKAAGIALSREQVAEIMEFEDRMWLRANPQVLELARELKSQGVATAILSNIPADLLAKLRRKFDWVNEFKVQIWSCEHGIIKPDAEIYRICLDALGCEPHRVLFFDDRPRNVEAAQRVGWEAHVFESAGQAREIMNRTAVQSDIGVVRR